VFVSPIFFLISFIYLFISFVYLFIYLFFSVCFPDIRSYFFIFYFSYLFTYLFIVYSIYNLTEDYISSWCPHETNMRKEQDTNIFCCRDKQFFNIKVYVHTYHKATALCCWRSRTWVFKDRVADAWNLCPSIMIKTILGFRTNDFEKCIIFSVLTTCVVSTLFSLFPPKILGTIMFEDFARKRFPCQDLYFFAPQFVTAFDLSYNGLFQELI
jgi:hypothetical protein